MQETREPQTTELLLPWHEGFWEYYHSKPPVDWQKQLTDRGTLYLAPDPLTGSLVPVSCPEEYYEYQEYVDGWMDDATVDPYADPFEGWYPFCEFDEPEESEEIFL